VVFELDPKLTRFIATFLSSAGNARAVEQAERAAAATIARESNTRNVNAMEAMLAEDQAAA
jgi:hypothetical protein